MLRELIIALVASLVSVGTACAQETYTFEPSEYQKRAFELSGYAEGKLEGFGLDRDSASYQLNEPAENRSSVNARVTGTLEATAKYQRDIATLNVTVHGDADRNVVFDDNSEVKLYEGGLALQPATGLSIYLGKRTLLWGKGYAWNPVGFVQRPKDPTDPNLSREGFVMATADYTHSFQKGPIQTIGLTLAFIPTRRGINSDFGRGHHDDVAAKLYLLVGHTDIDFMVLSGGARGARYGVDFSSAITPALEIHGELARITDSTRTVLDAAGQPVQLTRSATSYLLGLNYLTKSNTTFIVEYYHNGEGFQDSEGESFFRLAHNAFAEYRSTGSTALLQQAGTLSNMYMRPNPMRNYINFRVSQKEPFDILYFTPSVAIQTNTMDHSMTVLPELLYTGFTNVELRFRMQVNIGSRLTEFGEKQASTRAEFRVRYYF